MNHDLVSRLLLEMKPGPSGEISQRALLKFAQQVWDAAYKEGTYHGKLQELRKQTLTREILKI